MGALLAIMIIPACKFVPHLAEPLILISMGLSGYFRGSVFLISFIFTELIDCKKHPKVYNIWYSLAYLGDPFAMVINYFLL